MSYVINKNKNKIARYLTDSEFNLHTYEDVISSVIKTFDITLNKDNWEEQLQTIENELFLALGRSYLIKPKTEADEIQVIGAEVKAVEVLDGEMTFTYEGPAPTENISLIIKTIVIEEEAPSVIQACMFEGNILVEGDGQGEYSVDWAELTNEEVKGKIDEGYIPFYTGTAQLTVPSEEYTAPEKGFQAFTNIQHYTYIDEQTYEIDYIGIYAGQEHIFEQEKDINTGEVHPNPNYGWFEMTPPYEPEP